MALQKKIVYPNGIEINYHRIHRISFWYEQDNINLTQFLNAEQIEKHTPYNGGFFVEIELYSYLNKDIRNNDVEYRIESNLYHMLLTSEEIGTKPIMTLAYEFLKTLPEFVGAEDV